MKEAITVGAQTITRVLLPDEVLLPGGGYALWPDAGAPKYPVWFREGDESMEDAVVAVSSPYTNTTQRFEWPGAELWTGTLTLPPMTPDEYRPWEAALAQCRGMSNAFLLGDERYMHPGGRIDGNSKPVCATANVATDNLVSSKILLIRGCKSNVADLLLRGDRLQVGYRLYRVLDDVSSDGSGNASIEVWPSLREQPADGTAINLNRPRGLFGLADNKQSLSYDISKFTTRSIRVMEYL